MRKNLPLIFFLFLFSFAFSSCQQSDQTKGVDGHGKLHGKVSISGALALYPKTVLWREEYRKLNPKVIFDIQGGGAGKGMTDALSGTVDIGMVSRSINSEEVNKGAYAVTVAKDAVVGTMNN